MAREVLIQWWCDPCLADDVKTPGRELSPLQLPELTGKRPRVITLCEQHEKELYTPLVELLEEHGQPVDEEGNPTGKGRTPSSATPAYMEPITCPDCGHEAPNRSALSSHSRGQHGKTLGELLGLPLPHVCPECDYRSSRPQGLAAHRRQKHGVIGENTKAKARKRAADADQPTLDEEPEAEAPAPKKRARKRTA